MFCLGSEGDAAQNLFCRELMCETYGSQSEVAQNVLLGQFFVWEAREMLHKTYVVGNRCEKLILRI